MHITFYALYQSRNWSGAVCECVSEQLSGLCWAVSPLQHLLQRLHQHPDQLQRLRIWSVPLQRYLCGDVSGRILRINCNRAMSALPSKLSQLQQRQLHSLCRFHPALPGQLHQCLSACYLRQSQRPAVLQLSHKLCFMCRRRQLHCLFC